MSTPVNAKALEMRLKLKRLAKEHRLSPVPVNVPLTMATQHAQILEGYASTVDIDLDRTKIRGWAFGPPGLLAQTPIYYKHDLKQPAGKLMDIDYDLEGNLLVRVETHHPLARRAGAFSVAARVLDYEMRDVDGPNFYALIKSAELMEISLTDTPSNPSALVMERHRVSPAVQHLELMSARVEKLKQLTQLIKENV